MHAEYEPDALLTGGALKVFFMTLAFDAALERALAEGDEWNSWRALNLAGDRIDELPALASQDQLGAFRASDGNPSPGATGAALAHLVVVGAGSCAAAVIAADWLEATRTPAGA